MLRAAVIGTACLSCGALACTAEGDDPYATGTEIPCCVGLDKVLKDWRGDGNWFYKCMVALGPDPSPTPVPPAPKPSLPTGASIRVAKALGSRPYDQLRVSLVSDSVYLGASASAGWDYAAQFQHCDQNDASRFHLGTKLVSVQPGQTQTVEVGSYSVPVKLPRKGEGSVGLIMADPCIYQSEWCPYADRYSMKETLQEVLNALADHDELDYWMNVGDLFYDQDGHATADFFSGLSLAASGKIHGITMGNHDYWQDGSPGSAVSGDSFGNFHMQWYAQDAMSAKANPSAPFEFSQDPKQMQAAAANNFQWYNMIGNVAFVGFSNQADWQWQSSFFEEACTWVGVQQPELVVLLGHWNKQDDGCASGMDTPDAYTRIKSLPGCSQVSARIKYFEGHRHCNAVVEKNVGFMVGSFGMGGGRCWLNLWPEGDGAFGLPILDTRGARARLYYFQLGKNKQKTGNFDAILRCLKANGLSGCTSLPGVQIWMEEPLSAAALQNSSMPTII